MEPTKPKFRVTQDFVLNGQTYHATKTIYANDENEAKEEALFSLPKDAKVQEKNVERIQ